MKYTCSNTCTQHDFIINCYFHSKKFWYLTLQKINFIFYSMNKLLYFTVILYIVYYVAYIHVINCNKASIFKSLSLVKKKHNTIFSHHIFIIKIQYAWYLFIMHYVLHLQSNILCQIIMTLSLPLPFCILFGNISSSHGPQNSGLWILHLWSIGLLRWVLLFEMSSLLYSKFKICLWWHQRVDALIGRHHLQVPAVIENEGI